MPYQGPIPIRRPLRDTQLAIVAESRSMKRLLEFVQRIAPSIISVLLFGETGSGKDVIAQAIHRASGRTGPFVPVNCAAVPGTLAEAELFGHARGAFTGATDERRGLWVEADGGTLFLDEIGDLDLSLQSKLLRALEDGCIRPVGSNTSRLIDVRIIAATHCDLLKAVVEKRFREDLYHRLAGVTLTVPPLRERPEDIVPFAQMFMAEAVTGGTPVLTTDACSWLHAQSWRGNVRELRQAVRRAVLLVGSMLTAKDFIEAAPLAAQPPTPTPEEWLIGKTWEEIEAAVLLWAIRHHGSMRSAARALGRSKSTLADRARRLGVSSSIE